MTRVTSLPSISMQSPDSTPVRHERIVYVAPDCTDSAVKKRAHGFLRLGHELQSFTFRRDRYNVGAPVDWPNVEMGKSQERRLGARLATLFQVLRTIFQHPNVWRKATLIAARNLDLAVLTLIGKAVTRSRAPFVFEVLDVHPLLAQRSVKGAILRWVERRVLKRCQLLVVSSPAYLSEYFQQWQGFSGSSYLLENKWSDSRAFSGSRRLDYKIHLSASGKPQWVIGWFGNLRCPQSLEILLKVAELLPTQVSIYLRGCPSLLGQGTLERAILNRPNVNFGGEYTAPDEFASLYWHVHVYWCGDFLDRANSRWVIPNRIYEGGYFGVPALAVEGYETGRYVREQQLGVTLVEPCAETLCTYLSSLDFATYQQMRQQIEALPATQFLDHGELQRLVETAVSVR